MNEKPQTLAEAMPHEFMDYYDCEAYKYRDNKVVRKVDACEPGNHWPGRHRNVFVWFELDNGVLVAWNENPAIGWSFPVIKPKRKK